MVDETAAVALKVVDCDSALPPNGHGTPWPQAAAAEASWTTAVVPVEACRRLPTWRPRPLHVRGAAAAGSDSCCGITAARPRRETCTMEISPKIQVCTHCK